MSDLVEIVCVSCRAPLGKVWVDPSGIAPTPDWTFCSWVCIEKAVKDANGGGS